MAETIVQPRPQGQLRRDQIHAKETKSWPRFADQPIVATAPPVEGRVWFNTGPIPWNELKDRVVVLVFWSFGCDSSLVRMRQIQDLIESHQHGVHAIGVHTPKFAFEEDSDLVQAAVLQHRITMPVVHDPDAITWNRYNPKGWPSTVVIDGKGRVAGFHSGNGDIDLIDQAVTVAKNEIKDLDTTPHRDVVPPMPATPLAFPTATAVLSTGQLVISDSGHDRLVVVTVDPDRRGAAANLLMEGFHAPGDLAITNDDLIYVAEPALGSITQIELDTQSRRLCVFDLENPAGLAIDADDSLVVCDSGADTIYRVIDGGPHAVVVGAIAGTSRSGTSDGPSSRAELAQPSGVARTDSGLVFCDAASSRIRLLTDSGKVLSITIGGFYDRGLVDGPAHRAKLQRPTGIAQLQDGSVVIVDSGNNRLRLLSRRRLTTLGLQGLKQPTGVCVLPDGHLIVSDTGNHRLVIVSPDLESGWPLDVRGLDPIHSPIDTDNPTQIRPMSPSA